MKYLTPDKMFATYGELTPEYLQSCGINVLIMDIDHTLAPYEQPEPDEAIKAWISDMQAAGIGLAFVSNNNWERVELFNGEIGIPAFAKSGKPFGKTLRRVIKLYGSDAQHTAMLGDQLLTDVFAGKHIGATALLVPPIKEHSRKLQQSAEHLASHPWLSYLPKLPEADKVWEGSKRVK